MERSFLCLTMADVLCLAYLKTHFAREMKILEGSGWKISHVVIKKYQWQPLKVFTLKREGFHSWISSSVFLNLRTRYVHHLIIQQDFTIATKPASPLYSTNTRKILGLKGKRQISSIQSADQGSLMTVVIRDPTGHFISPLLLFPRKYMKP